MNQQTEHNPDTRLAFEPLGRPIATCPFCGIAPEIKEREGGTGESPYLCFIVCYCGTYTAHAHQSGRGDTALHALQDAVDLWNRRA